MMAAPSNGATRGARRLAEKIRAEMRRMDKGTKDPPTIVHLRALQSRVVREDPDLVLINKPSGLSVHGGPSVSRSLASLLPALSQMLFGRGADPLRLCHRLDRDTTGALILARSKEAADRVQQQLRERSAHKVYWALCVGVPTPLEGIVDIPVVERETAGPQHHYKMSLSPRFGVSHQGKVHRIRVCRSAREAVTRYRTLAEAYGVSLLELQPITGVKHQLRVHLALALSCPILGDHKYSHWGRLAPQKPPNSVLQALGLSAAQARSLSLHLHAAQITLSSAKDSSPIILRCPPPRYFLNSLRRLRIPPPSLQGIDLPPQD